jgi:hypothetical protein
MAVRDQFKQHTAAGAGAPATRYSQNFAGYILAAQRMVQIYNFTCERMNSTPKANTGVGIQYFALSLTID